MFDETMITISYEVTPLTMAVLSGKDDKGSRNTVVLEEKKEYTVHTTPTKMIDEACKFFGSSLKGRLEGTKDISRITHKAPIAIDPSSGMYFFPTASPSNEECSWIAHSHVKDIQSIGKTKTEIIFKNGRRIIINVSYGSMMNQLQRTAQFRYSLDTRMKILKAAIENKKKDKE
ncbi:competence protein ComK [Pseudogracilibacillus sp. SO30301A]|uniref:competence protein ComK n=1 Tax=Pseudogracilibacillus sp. SO30301A TaxID=3098291 RepID=UPI00300E36D3